jgi:transcriptional regulator with XRE-family HTH domain
MRSDLPLCANSARRPASMSRNYARNQAERRLRLQICRSLHAAGYTHQEIANKLGVDRSAVTYYLSGRCNVRLPQPEMANA